MKKMIFLNHLIFCITFYENETFGIVNIEAMMFKLFISTDEGGITDIVKNNETGFI